MLCNTGQLMVTGLPFIASHNRRFTGHPQNLPPFHLIYFDSTAIGSHRVLKSKGDRKVYQLTHPLPLTYLIGQQRYQNLPFDRINPSVLLRIKHIYSFFLPYLLYLFSHIC